jgi:hypothetical protein
MSEHVSSDSDAGLTHAQVWEKRRAELRKIRWEARHGRRWTRATSRVRAVNSRRRLGEKMEPLPRREDFSGGSPSSTDASEHEKEKTPVLATE